MKRFKNITKQLVTLCLVMAMAITMLPQAAQARTIRKKMTLYVGGDYTYSSQLKASNIKSSNKKIVTAKKGKYDTSIDFVAKKAGKATVTCKLKGNPTTFDVTVKKPSISISMAATSKGYVLFSFKNKTKQTFDKITYKYTLKDKNGKVLKQNTQGICYLLAKKTTYYTMYITKDMAANIDYKKCTAKVTSASYEAGETYTDISSKVDLFAFDQEETESGFKFSVNIDNLSGKTAIGYYYIMVYDKNKKLIGVMDTYDFYLNAGDSKQYKDIEISKSEYGFYPGAHSYKLVMYAFSTSEKKGWTEKLTGW